MKAAHTDITVLSQPRGVGHFGLRVRKAAIAAIIILMALALPAAGFAAGHLVAADSLVLFEILNAGLDSSSSAVVNDLTLNFPDIEFHFEKGSFYQITYSGGRASGLYFDGNGTAVFAPSDTGEARWLDGKTGGANGVERYPFTHLYCRFADWQELKFSSPPVFTPLPHAALPAQLHKRLEEWFTGNLRAGCSVAPPVRLFYDRKCKRHPGNVYAVFGRRETSASGCRHYSFIPEERKSISYNGWCHYAPANADSTVADMTRNLLRPIWYDFEARIDTSTQVSFNLEGHFVVLDSAVSSIFLDLALDFSVSSVVDDANLPVLHWPARHPREYPGLLLLLNRAYNPGDTVHLRFAYHGRPEHVSDGEAYHFRKDVSWFPTTKSFYSAVFDARFVCPARWTVAATGQKIKEITRGAVTSSYWVVLEGAAGFSFMFGSFVGKEYRYEGIPPLSVLVPVDSGDGRDRLQDNAYESAAADMLNALSYFRQIFGPFPFRNLTVVEMPAPAAAYPSLIQLPPQIFGARCSDAAGTGRGCGVACQWWDNLVRAATDEDRWFIDGIVEYSSALYILKSHKRMDIFKSTLDSWRDSIFAADRRILGEPRRHSNNASFQRAKGAWVIHMLRMMMLDLDISTDRRFAAMLRDFLEYYRGQEVTARDFQHQAELYYGESLDWFFRQWVYSPEIPTYSSRYRVEQVPDNGYYVYLQVEQLDVSAGFRMPVPLTITFRHRRPYHQRIWVYQHHVSVTIGPFDSMPEQIIFNDLDGVLSRSGGTTLPLADTDRSPQ
jgi:hypothetical protein